MGSCPKLGAKNAWESSGKLKAKVPIRCSRGGGVGKHHNHSSISARRPVLNMEIDFQVLETNLSKIWFAFSQHASQNMIVAKIESDSVHTNVMIEAVYLFCKQKQKQGSVPPKSQIQNASTEKVLHAPHFSRIVSPFLGSKE